MEGIVGPLGRRPSLVESWKEEASGAAGGARRAGACEARGAGCAARAAGVLIPMGGLSGEAIED